MTQHISLLNIYTGALMGALTVPPYDDNDAMDDVIDATFAAYYLSQGMPADSNRAHHILSDGSAGTFTWGPLTGAWEFLDHGQQPCDRTGSWVTNIIRMCEAGE